MPSEPFVGELMLFGGTFAPRGWALCNGQLLPINQNQALFALLGTTYGGNGQTNFALPDLRGRAPVHFGDAPDLDAYVQGTKLGSERIVLGEAQLPPHSHTTRGSTVRWTSTRPGAGLLPASGGQFGKEAPADMGPTGVAGGGQPVDVRQPVLVVNWCIALQGIFPARD